MDHALHDGRWIMLVILLVLDPLTKIKQGFPTTQPLNRASGVICTEGINSRICSPADQCPNISQERMAVVQAITS